MERAGGCFPASEAREPVIFSPWSGHETRVGSSRADAGVCMALLERPRQDVCVCWFDTEIASEADFDALFGQYRKGDYVHARLGTANQCMLYGVYARRSGTDLLSHAFPDWVNFEYPIGDEDPMAFFSTMMGVFSRSTVEALDGFSVKDIL